MQRELNSLNSARLMLRQVDVNFKCFCQFGLKSFILNLGNIHLVDHSLFFLCWHCNFLDKYRRMLPTFSAVKPFSFPKYSGSPVGLRVYLVSLQTEESQVSNFQFYRC